MSRPDSEPRAAASAPGWLKGFLRLQQIREAVASVALSHKASCRCTVCRAANGDERALAEVMERVNDGLGI